MEAAIAYEIERQISVIESGQKVSQETRGWDEIKGKTFTQRSKETAKDYRYFPDPDLPKLHTSIFSEILVSRQDDIFESLPTRKRLKYTNLGLLPTTIETIIQDATLSSYFESVLTVAGTDAEAKTIVLAANYLLTDFSPQIMSANSHSVILSPQNFWSLIAAVSAGKITTRVAKDIIIALALTDADPIAYATSEGLLGGVSSDDVATLVAGVLSANESVVAEYRAGKTAALQYLLGQAMKQSRGAIDPKTITEQIIVAIG